MLYWLCYRTKWFILAVVRHNVIKVWNNKIEQGENNVLFYLCVRSCLGYCPSASWEKEILIWLPSLCNSTQHLVEDLPIWKEKKIIWITSNKSQSNLWFRNTEIIKSSQKVLISTHPFSALPVKYFHKGHAMSREITQDRVWTKKLICSLISSDCYLPSLRYVNGYFQNIFTHSW